MTSLAASLTTTTATIEEAEGARSRRRGTKDAFETEAE